MPPKIVFMGSPDFALPSLYALHTQYSIVGVITQADKPSGRGQKISSPLVKQAAQVLGIPLIQPHKLKEEEAMRQLRAWAPDLIVVVAYGQILRQEVLDQPTYGCINVHASLLPRWRGAGPIQAAILHGDAQTGVTIMKMNAGMDTGDILKQASISIPHDCNAGSLSEQLSQLGAQLLIETLPTYLKGELTAQSQDNALATYSPKIEKSHGELDFMLTAVELAQHVRAYNPWPTAYTQWKGELLKVLKAHAEDSPSLACGERLIQGKSPAYSTAKGILVLDLVQQAGKKPVSADQFLLGAKGWLT